MNVLDITGKATGTITLPKEVFYAPVYPNLIAQAVRVYLANQRAGGAATKTRGKVEGSTRKIYKQKGTGRARHGSIRAHIFVGGGVVFGPVPHDFHLNMPKKMKSKALASILSQKREESSVIVVEGLEKIEPKTKLMAKALAALEADKKTLVVVGAAQKNIVKATRNITKVQTLTAHDLHTYAVYTNKKVLFTKQAVDELKGRFV